MSEQEKGVSDMTATNEAVPAVPTISAESRNWAVLTHLSAFVMLVGIPAIIGPVVAWAIKKDEDPYVDFHGKEAMNFNISFLIYSAVSAILLLVLVGFLLLPLVLITWFVLVIVAAVRASDGEYYRYPFTIRFIS